MRRAEWGLLPGFVLILGLSLNAQDGRDDRLDRLISRLEHRNRKNREAARQELERLAPRHWKALQKRAEELEDGPVRAALEKLAEQGRKQDPERILGALPEIIEARGWERSVPLPGQLASHLQQALRDRGFKVTPDLLPRLLLRARQLLSELKPAPHANVIAGLARSLADTLTPETREAVLEALLEMLDHSEPLVRAAAADALASVDAREAGPDLLRHARSDIEIVRLHAIEALVALDASGAADALNEMLEDPGEDIREAALRALFALAPERGKARLPAMLRDESAAVRRSALDLAQRLRTPGLHEIVVNLLNDETADIRAAAARYIGMVRDAALAENALPLLKDRDGDVRRRAVNTLVFCGLKEHAGKIRPLLRDPDTDVRSAAIRGLGLLGDRDAVEEIARRLRSRRDDDEAMMALARLGAEQYAPQILQKARARDERYAVEALTALSELRDPDTADELLDLLDRRRLNASAMAIFVLARLRHRESAEEVTEFAGRQARGRRGAALLLASDAYHVLALNARSRRRLEEMLNDRRRAWFAQLWLNLLKEGDAFEAALERYFDPRSRTLREAHTELRRLLGLKIRAELPDAFMDRELLLLTPLSVSKLFERFSQSVGYNAGLIFEDGVLRLVPRRRAREYWLSWDRERTH